MAAGGTILVRVDSTQIDVILDRASPDALCSDALVPFRVLVNPHDHVAGELQMSQSFNVRLLRVEHDGEESVELSREVQLADSPPPTVSAQSGSWTSRGAPKSAITIEQQGGLLGAIIAGTNSAPGKWQLAAGALNGNVFTGSLQQVEEVPCEPDEPCESKRVNREVGRVNILIEGLNSMLVDIRHRDQHHIQPGLVRAPNHYTRFNLEVNDPDTNQLVFFGDFFGRLTRFPDLTGTWFAGSGDHLQRIEIQDADVNFNQADYTVATTADPQSSVLPASPRIRCGTGDAGPGTAICAFQNRNDPDACGPQFRVVDAGETRVQGFNPCGDDPQEPFFMFRQ